jgi:glycosyltransferase involved in cell wall biosynthesis
MTAALSQLAASGWNLRAKHAVKSSARKFRPDVAHVHNTWFALSPSILRALGELDIPIVVTLHNYRLLCINGLLFRDGHPCRDCVGSHPLHGVRHRCYRDSRLISGIAAGALGFNQLRRSWPRDTTLFLALTNFARDQFVRGGVPADRLRIKSNFILDAGPRLRAPSRSSTILYVGRLSREKGLNRLLDAWDRSRPPSLRLLIIGDGPLRPELEQRRISGVEMAGALRAHEIAPIMRDARALAFPSLWYEGQPMVLLEALSAGLPILASDLGGIPETAGAASGWFVPPNDVDAWASALTSLADNQRIDDAGEAARKRYETLYTPSQALIALEAAYAHSLGRTPASSNPTL